MNHLNWVEVDCAALGANLGRFRSLLGPRTLLAPSVKANAYGHGLVLAGQAFAAAGADWLTLNSVEEARALRAAGLELPLYIMGMVARQDLVEALALGCRLVVYNGETVEAAAEALRHLPAGTRARLHLKIETGNYRQGLSAEGALALAEQIAARPGLELEGAATHFADIEDTTDHSYAREQFRRFREALALLEGAGHALRVRHCSNSAATLLWPETHLDLVRLGIGAFGMWPSAQTQVSAVLEGRHGLVALSPALTWKTRVAQVKEVPAGAFVGYGRSYRTTHASRLAILPVGYYDGYDRGLSNLAYVLIHGSRAPVRGRVCMNMTIVDVTDIGGVQVEDEAVLLGAQGDERISAEQMAEWLGTINYEVTTRIGVHLPRVAAQG